MAGPEGPAYKFSQLVVSGRDRPLPVDGYRRTHQLMLGTERGSIITGYGVTVSLWGGLARPDGLRGDVLPMVSRAREVTMLPASLVITQS